MNNAESFRGGGNDGSTMDTDMDPDTDMDMDSMALSSIVSPIDERDAVVELLAKHADHLKTPTRFLRRLYHPPPETSDSAKANAVLTECQILAMQFVFVRPLTSIANCVLTVMHEMHEKQAEQSNSTIITFVANDEDGLHSGLNGTIADSGFGGGGDNGDNTGDGISNIGNETRRWLEQMVNDTLASSSLDGSEEVDDGNSTSPISLLSDPDGFQQETINYFTSPGFIVAMITNISVFLAFTGLLKFYHAVRGDLAWCTPFPKFLTIKGVVFLTFWQGLAIRIGLSIENSRADDDSRLSGVEIGRKAVQIQNVVICLEMLFFSITHWCVFPAEEWQPGFEASKQRQRRRRESYGDEIEPSLKPGIGLNDFVQDVSHIYNARRRVRRRGKARYTMQPRIETDGVHGDNNTLGEIMIDMAERKDGGQEEVRFEYDYDEDEDAT